MLKPKIKLTFLDHSYHFKTRSGNFLRDIFKSKFLIKDSWVDKNLKIDLINIYISYYSKFITRKFFLFIN